MAELLATLATPLFVERVSVHDPRHIVRAKKAIQTAFEYQVKGACFSLVEVLSTCPTNWGKTPEESTRWLDENMIPFYPLKRFRTPDVEGVL
jgi:2-oxoglutarate ferredoxin oxidoreductase subunit beta